MNEHDKQIYIERYNKRLSEHGYDPKTLGWGGGHERQELRFRVFAESVLQRDDSVLDVGCGFCDLYGYLRRTGWRGNYLGVDINGNLLDTAREIYPGVQTSVVDILETRVDRTFSWTFASGVFNAKLSGHENLQHIEAMLGRMFALSETGAACDFMSTFVDWQHPDAYHMNPYDALKIAKKLTWKVLLRMDYLPHEFMLFLFRDKLV